MIMENRNVEQVWQRVFAGAPAKREDFRGLLMAAMELAALHRQLTQVLTGSPRERAKRLLEGEQTNVSSLRGMQLLSGGGMPSPKALTAPKEPARKMLEKSYHLTRRALTEYTARLADPEFGAVFGVMADRERQHCAQIAATLGELRES